MKQIILVIFFSLPAFAQITPNLHLNIPPTGTLNWGGLVNGNFSTLDTALACFGTASTPGTIVYYNGATWVCVAGNTSGNKVLQESSTGVPSWVVQSGGGGSTPGGSTGDLQYNLDGSNFGGFGDGTANQVLHGGRTFSSIALGTADVSGILGITNGGTGSVTPGILQGSCIIVTGSFPNQTIAKSGAAGCGTGGGGSYATLKVMSAYGGNAQAALNDMSPGDTMMVDGTYSLCSGTMTASNVVLEGSGFQSGTLQCGTNNVPVLTASGNGALIQQLNIKHTVNPIAGGDGLVIANGTTSTRVMANLLQLNYNGLVLGPSSFGIVAFNYLQRNNANGVLFKSDGVSQVMQWAMNNNLSQQNLGDGYNFVLGASISGLQITCPVFSGETAYGNAGHGWNISASAATSSGIADCFWSASSFASINNASGFYWDPGATGGRNFQISGGFSEDSGYYDGPAGYAGTIQVPTHVGYGLEITSACDSTISPEVIGMIFWQNAYSGAISACPGTEFEGINAFKSGLAGSANSWQRAGVAIRATNIGVHGGYFRNSGATQIYGVDVSNSADTPDVSGVRCDASTTTCVQASTAPTNGFQTRVGNRRIITGNGAPAMACANGDEYHRYDTGNFSTLYACKNAVWVAVN